ncbi:nuclear RNA export factor 1-like isoform X1 [Branchiostoma lanceolatum]|uniref:nuclear RNA export factor 1-like isoform X1 n=2 Tax=Branchiostoma lanceolatum TaxID=7740 RepID=UPI0034513EAD
MTERDDGNIKDPFQKTMSCGGVAEEEKVKRAAEQTGKREGHTATSASTGRGGGFAAGGLGFAHVSMYGGSTRKEKKKCRRKRPNKGGQRRGGYRLTSRFNPYADVRLQSSNPRTMPMLPMVLVPAELFGQCSGTQVYKAMHSNTAKVVAEDGRDRITVPVESKGQDIETHVHDAESSSTVEEGAEVSQHKAVDSKLGAEESAKVCKDDWHKITVLHGKRYKREWLTNQLQKLCPVPFQPTDLHYAKAHMVFYVPDKTTASGLNSISKKIKTKIGFKLIILTKPEIPPSLQVVDEATMEAMKLCIVKRFDAATSSLNLSNMYWDTELKAQNIRVPLNQKKYMNSVIAIIKDNVSVIDHLDMSDNKLYSLNGLADLVSVRGGVTSLNISHNELKSESELEKIEGWNLEMLWMNDNPLCNHYCEQYTYISTVRRRFPNVVRLDGQVYSLPTES